MQSANYWKNARQQGLPFTADPRITYRGYVSNCANFVSCTVFQFAVNGAIKRALIGDKPRSLSAMEEISAALVAGVGSAGICGPLELIMIQQQRKGGSILSTIGNISSRGVSAWSRGLVLTAGREGIYTAGYLGVTPVIRSSLQARFPKWNEEICRAAASLCGGLFACYSSHPCDTVKTCLQGDLEGKKFANFTQTASKLVKEGGIASLYKGSPWRLFRQVSGIYILDKARVTLSPMLFPDRF